MIEGREEVGSYGEGEGGEVGSDAEGEGVGVEAVEGAEVGGIEVAGGLGEEFGEANQEGLGYVKGHWDDLPGHYVEGFGAVGEDGRGVEGLED